jgi:hypothetical protein
MTTTTDLKDFGFRELRMAAELLTAYCDNLPSCLGDGVHLTMNTHSGCVFLTDEDFYVAMMNGDAPEQFHSCPECGAEGFAEDMPDSECCRQYLKEVQS